MFPRSSYTGRGSRTIANMFLNDVGNSARDDIGPRVAGSQLNYGTTSVAVTWIGAATMAKPIGDFHITTPGTYNGNRPPTSGSILGSWTGQQANNLRIRVHSVIPEPEEYALVFGLFALGFVLFHRHFQKKQRQQATTTIHS